MESHLRSLLKAISWRVWATIITFFVSWVLTGEIALAAKIGLLDTTIKLAAYYGHERMWIKIPIGKLKPPEYEI